MVENNEDDANNDLLDDNSLNNKSREEVEQLSAHNITQEIIT